MTNKIGETLDDINKDPVKRNQLIDRNNLLNGIIFSLGAPTVSSMQLIQRPEGKLDAVIDPTGQIVTETVEVEFSKQLTESNYTKAAVGVSAYGVKATADYSQEHKYVTTNTQKTVYFSARYRFTQGRIDFHKPGSGIGSVNLTKQYTNAIDNALAKSTPLEKREALDEIYQQYGHVFRDGLTIGGVLSVHTAEIIYSTEKEEEVKKDIGLTLEAEVKGWGGSGSVGHGNQTKHVTTEKGRKLTVEYRVTGGDYTKILNTDAWIATTNDPNFWRVIEVVSVIPVEDLLPPAIGAEVKRLRIPLLGKWVDAVEQSIPSLPVKIYRPKDIPSGWFWVGHHVADSASIKALLVQPTLPPKAGRNYAINTGHASSDLPPQPVVDQACYEFMATYYGVLNFKEPPGSALRALRPDVIDIGRQELHKGIDADHSVLITRPKDINTNFNLGSPVRLSQVKKPIWTLRKDAVLFED